MRLGIHEEYEEPFECNPATVNSHEFPADCLQGNGIDIVREEKTNLAPNLLDTDTAGSDVIWEELDKERWNLSDKILAND